MNKYYLFSNLFWGFRWPYYDAVFGFMWYLLGLANFEKEKIIDQIHLWHKFIFKVNKKEKDLISLALIERYLAALNLDVLMINDEKKIIKMKEILFTQLKNLKKANHIL